MSAFSDWFDNERPPMYSVHTDRQSQDRCIAEQAFYAGMERAAEIAENDETDCINASDHYGCTQGSGIAESIRKEIERA